MNPLPHKAWVFASRAHDKQMYGNKPYMYHLEQVAENVLVRMQGDPLCATYVAVAWLHDVMEDCGVTYQELEREFGICIADAVQRLTKTEDRSYEAYMNICIESAIAREVKICDTMANLTESFKSSANTNPAIRTKGEKGLAKYPKQLTILVTGVYYD